MTDTYYSMISSVQREGVPTREVMGVVISGDTFDCINAAGSVGMIYGDPEDLIAKYLEANQIQPEELTPELILGIAVSRMSYMTDGPLVQVKNSHEAKNAILARLKLDINQPVNADADAISRRLHEQSTFQRENAYDLDLSDAENDDFDDMSLILQSVSDSSPEGPNGWLYRIATGQDPLPGDELGVVTF